MRVGVALTILLLTSSGCRTTDRNGSASRFKAQPVGSLVAGVAPIQPADAKPLADGGRWQLVKQGRVPGPQAPARMHAQVTVWDKSGRQLFTSTTAKAPLGIDLDALSLPLREVVRLTGVGGTVRLWLPPEAMEGWKPQSFPNEELVYEVEIVGESTPASAHVYGSPAEAASAIGATVPVAPVAPTPPDLSGPPKDARMTRLGVKYAIVNVGSGQHPKKSAKAHISFNAWAARGLTLETIEHDKSEIVTPGSAPGGLGEVLEQLGRGGRARIWVPASKAVDVLPQHKDEALIVDITLDNIDAD